MHWYEMKFKKEDHFCLERIERRGNRNIQIGKFYCLLNNKTYETLGGLRNAIKSKMTIKEYFKKYYATEEDLSPCCVCGTNERIFNNVIEGFKHYCSSGCFNKTIEHRLSVKNRFKNDEQKKIESLAKAKKTNESKSIEDKDDINLRRLSTLKQRYGYDYLSNRTRDQWARRDKNARKLLAEKAVATKLKNGTAEYNFYAAANRHIVLNDKVYFCQGYEDSVLKFLIEDMDLHVEDVLVGKDVPRINFDGNKSGKYHPDIFVKSLNLIIEVKSDYTYEQEIRKTKGLKQAATISQGYNHLYVVLKSISKNRSMINQDKNDLREYITTTISSQAHLNEKVQRLSRDWEYRTNAIGSGSAKVPHNGT